MAEVNLRPLIHPDAHWLDHLTRRRAGVVAFTAFCGLFLYGFTVGFWRSPVMGAYVAVKMPLLVLLTLLCNGLLNGLLGLLLGTGLGFRQSWFALAWNAPPPTSPGGEGAHAAYLLTHTALVAFAGTNANLHLHRVLGNHGGGGGPRSPRRRSSSSSIGGTISGSP